MMILICQQIEHFNKKNQSLDTIEISNPIFKNKGLNTNPYEISAKKGIHIKNDIELYVVFGKFTNDNSEINLH